MKTSRAFLSAIALASATLVSQTATAGPITSTTTEIVLVDNKASVEKVLTGGNAGTSFANLYQFTIADMGDFNADLSLGNGANKSLNITGFTLLDSSGKAISSASGSWMLDVDNLAAGKYTLQVSGNLMTNAAGKYYANLMLGPSAVDAAVPEPASAGLLLAGLGMLGLTARRRRAAKAKQA